MSEHNVAHTEEAHGEGHAFEPEKGVHHVHGSKKEIWKVFFILLAITVLEFIIALTPIFREKLGKNPVVGIFLFLTIIKAFYIVGYFMHLRHEKMNMAYTILIPLLFILYLIALMMLEGVAVFTHSVMHM